MPQTEYAIQLEHVTKTFGPVIANHDVTMNIRRGEILSLLGENGSGKTTLLRCLNFLEKPEQGTISVAGNLIFDAADPATQRESEVRKKRLHFGLVFQSFNLFPQYTALQNVTLAKELLSQERPDFKQNKKQILDKGNFFPSPFAAMNTQLLFHGSEHLEMLVQQLLVCGQLGIGPFKVAHHVPACLFFTFRSSHILDLGQFF